MPKKKASPMVVTQMDEALDAIRRERPEIEQELREGFSLETIVMEYARQYALNAIEAAEVRAELEMMLPARPFYASKKLAYGYYNFEWNGNDVILHGEDKKTIHLTGEAARKFEAELDRLEDTIPHDESLEQAVNAAIKMHFDNSTL